MRINGFASDASQTAALRPAVEDSWLQFCCTTPHTIVSLDANTETVARDNVPLLQTVDMARIWMQNNQDILGGAVAAAASASIAPCVQRQLRPHEVRCAWNDRVLHGKDGKDLREERLLKRLCERQSTRPCLWSTCTSEMRDENVHDMGSA
mmetsp:Transcript_9923/g.60576  ORF Transcript_9923/g.60576 Transcript_9923/m.60576 type:complete len:151 (-) Transcript_9923:703-1155(-)